jgi:hypothetical protein
MKQYHGEWQLFLLMQILWQCFSYFWKMLYIFSSHPFYTKHVSLPGTDDPVSSQIYDNPKFWSFYKDTLGALDGSHIHSAPPASERPVHRNCKGFISQNCLFGCSFDLQFVYSLTGWEGSVSDHGYTKMPAQGILIFWMENIVLWMRDSRHANNFSFPTVVYGITSLNGAVWA